MNSGLLEQYVLGLLDEVAVQEVEDLLDAHPELREYVRDLRVTLTAVSFQNGVRPPEAKGQKARSEARRTEEAAKGLAPKVAGLHVFSWILLAGLTFLNVYLSLSHQRISSQHSQLKHEVASLYTRLNELRDEESILHVMADSATHRQDISGNYEGEEISAWMFVNEQLGVLYFHPGRMPELPQGQYFQIWAEVDEEVQAISKPFHHMNYLEPLEFVPGVEHFFITIEHVERPASGVASACLIASGPSGIKQPIRDFDPSKSQ